MNAPVPSPPAAAPAPSPPFPEYGLEPAGAARFVDLVEHELKTPLAALLGFTDLLREPGAIPAKDAPDICGSLAQEGRRLLRTVEALVAWLRRELGVGRSTAEPWALEAELRSLVSALEAGAPSPAVRFVVTGAGPTRPVAADSTHLRRALEGLLAGLAARAAGPVRIRMEEDAAGATVTLENDGPAAPGAVASLTEAKHRTGATGLVLLDAARTVRAAGGRLEVRPAGRGASVRLFLPHARGEAGGTP